MTCEEGREVSVLCYVSTQTQRSKSIERASLYLTTYAIHLERFHQPHLDLSVAPHLGQHHFLIR